MNALLLPFRASPPVLVLLAAVVGAGGYGLQANQAEEALLRGSVDLGRIGFRVAVGLSAGLLLLAAIRALAGPVPGPDTAAAKDELPRERVREFEPLDPVASLRISDEGPSFGANFSGDGDGDGDLPAWQRRLRDKHARPGRPAPDAAPRPGPGRAGPAHPVIRAERPRPLSLRRVLVWALGSVFALLLAAAIAGVLAKPGASAGPETEPASTAPQATPDRPDGGLFRSLFGGGITALTPQTGTEPGPDVISRVDQVSGPGAAAQIAEIVAPTTPEEDLGRWDIDLAPIAQWFIQTAILAATGDSEAVTLLGGTLLGLIIFLVFLRLGIRAIFRARRRTAIHGYFS